MSPEVMARLRDLARSNYDVRDLLIVFDQLKKPEPITDVDPTGGLNPDFKWDGNG